MRGRRQPSATERMIMSQPSHRRPPRKSHTVRPEFLCAHATRWRKPMVDSIPLLPWTASFGGADDRAVPSAHWSNAAATAVTILGRPVILAGLFVAAVFLAGCWRSAPIPHDPSVVGVVEAYASDGRTAQLGLRSGVTLTIEHGSVQNLGPSTQPGVGDLLLYGVEPDGPWYVALPRSDPSGFVLYSPVRPDVGNTITFESGLRLRIAPEYVATGSGTGEADVPIMYIINDDGEVIARM